jgi:uncharacterized membrane protein YgdD (TMEM256/DUF423 family)
MSRNWAIFAAGWMGAFGVALAAIAAHGGDMGRLGPASAMLLFHAPALLALAALAATGAIRKLGSLAAAGLLLGVTLFSGDLAIRHFADHPLFPMAAPIGGTVMIASWIALGIAGLLPRRP